MMWILSVTVLLPAVVAFPVFTFNESSSSKPAPSFADLAKDVDLPNSFILCSSVKHARFDDVGFFLYRWERFSGLASRPISYLLKSSEADT